MNIVTRDENGTYIKIANFNIKLKTAIIMGSIIGVVVLMAVASKVKEEREFQERVEAAQAEMAEIEAQREQAGTAQIDSTMDYDEMMQQRLREKYGEPPEGFIWSMTGNLVATGDSEHTAEDVVWIYIQSLSMLDFATAQRYAEKSTVANTYQGYFGTTSTAMTSYSRNFERRVYKQALESLEIVDFGSTSVFADGTEIITVNLLILDLTDKDFWQKDRDELFEILRTYNEAEVDSTKASQYLYDYIYDAYESGAVGKRAITIEIVLSKSNGGGWLISDDKEIDSALLYDWGTDVATFIQRDYQNWYRQIIIQETFENTDDSYDEYYEEDEYNMQEGED